MMFQRGSWMFSCNPDVHCACLEHHCSTPGSIVIVTKPGHRGTVGHYDARNMGEHQCFDIDFVRYKRSEVYTIYHGGRGLDVAAVKASQEILRSMLVDSSQGCLYRHPRCSRRLWARSEVLVMVLQDRPHRKGGHVRRGGPTIRLSERSKALVEINVVDRRDKKSDG